MGVSKRFTNAQAPWCSYGSTTGWGNAVCIVSALAKTPVSLRAELDLEPRDHSFTTGITGSHNLEFPNGHNCLIFLQ